MPTPHEELAALADPDVDAAFLHRYLGTTRPILGARTDALRALARATARANPTRSDAEWLARLDDLYAGPSFEAVLLGGHLLHALPALRRRLDLARLRAWLAPLQGWCEVDTTCQNGWTAHEVLARWDEWQPFLDSLSAAPEPPLRRASLVLPVAPLRASAETRLRDQALAAAARLAPERDPLITKAISWNLRTLLKHHAADVPPFLAAHPELAAHVRREVQRKIETGRR